MSKLNPDVVARFKAKEFHSFLSPFEYIAHCNASNIQPGQSDASNGEHFQELSRRAQLNGKCENCDLHEYRLGGTGLCFPCTTGESDASGDFEIGEFYELYKF